MNLCALAPATAVTPGPYISLRLPVFLINSKWNCKQMKQFSHQNVPRVSLSARTPPAKVHKSSLPLPAGLLPPLKANPSLLNVLFPFFLFGNVTVNPMLLHIQLQASVCTIHTSTTSPEPHEFQLCSSHSGFPCHSISARSRSRSLARVHARLLRDSLSKVGFPFGVI